jgi:cytidylate kinase
MPTEAIAIDGPAGAGKSTVAKSVANALGFTYLDTGAMYRAVALIALQSGLTQECGDEAAILAKEMDFEFLPGNPQRVIVNGNDVTDEIRTPEISEAASALSAHSPLRKELVRRQKELLAAGNVVLEGRDTTTVVCPDARLKVYLDASVQERARRRHAELPPNSPETIESIEAQITARDERDRSRDDSPLTVASDAIVIVTDNLTPDQVAEQILTAWKASLRRC